MKQSEKMIVHLTDPCLNAYVNYGNGLEKYGVLFKNYGIEFRAQFEEGTIPTYVIQIDDYLYNNGVDAQNISSIQIVGVAYDVTGEEIELSEGMGKCELVSEDAMDGYSDSDILPNSNICAFGSHVITTIDVCSFTGYKADGITFCSKSLEDMAGINIQLFTPEPTRIDRFVVAKVVIYMGRQEQATTTSENKVIEADLNDPSIHGFMNLGTGPMDYCVQQLDGVMIFESKYDEELHCMLGVNFSEYLKKINVKMEELASFEIQMGVYDATGAEISFVDNYQKCAFVSAESLNGYSDSDILSKGNYKLLGSQVNTVFDLCVVNDKRMPHRIDEGVGFNVQILNGDRSKTKYVSLNNLRFIRK